MWRKQAIIEWSWHVNSIVACCHSAKLCAHAARDFWSQQNGAVTRMWRSCQGQPSHKERAIGAVVVKRRGCCCNLSGGDVVARRGWCCNLSGGVALNVWFATNGMWVKNNTIHTVYVARTSRVIMACVYVARNQRNKQSDHGKIEWSWHVNSIVACCHSAKLCAHAARNFRSQQ